jgi:hypothetical protein
MFRSTLLVGYVLALVVLAVGFLEGGTSGPCATSTRFVKDNPGAAEFRAERQLFPPGRRCVALADDGAVLVSHSYPELGDYALALLLLLTPLGLWEAYRARRRPAFRAAVAVGAALAFVAWSDGYFKGGLDGVCGADAPLNGGRFKEDGRLLPPGHRCVGTSWDGSRTAAGPWYPAPSHYLAAGAVFLFPFALWGARVCIRAP